MNEPDSPVSSIPSQVSSPGSHAADGGGASNDEQMPRVRESLAELQRRVNEQVQRTVRDLRSDLGPALKAPSGPRRRNTAGEFTGLAAVKFIDFVNMKNNGPATLKEAVRSPESTHWEDAVCEEIENLEAHGTWELLEVGQVAAGHIPITTEMTLVKKHDGNGKLTRYKGWLVAHAFKQRPAVDFDETYALLVSPVVVRTSLSYAAAQDLEIM